MSLGNKILELRKKNNFSQEELAEKIGVARQTISKWELDETNPDLKQARELSKIFKVSLDELVDNDIKELLVEKVTNTEKLSGLVYKILKFICICFIIMSVIFIVMFILFTFVKKQPSESSTKQYTMNCSVNDFNYTITVGNNGYFNCDNCDKKMNVYLSDLTDWANLENGKKNIINYFEQNGGNCKNS